MERETFNMTGTRGETRKSISRGQKDSRTGKAEIISSVMSSKLQLGRQGQGFRQGQENLEDRTTRRETFHMTGTSG